VTFRGRDADDPEAFDRPGRGSRPRTKDRPVYSGAETGMVVTIDRGRFRVLVDDREVSATKARQLGRTGVVVGDLVRLVGDTSGTEGTLARIVEVEDRTTVLRRTADDKDPYERPIVANADQLVIVAALADPPPRTGMIDRILVAGYDAGIAPLLCLTKVDLAPPDEILAAYEPLGVPMLTTRPGADLGPLREALSGRSSVFVGQSGVGKSTLVNALIPGAGRATGDISLATGKGRHISTSAVALALPTRSEGAAMPPEARTGSAAEPAGWVIDTPGVRSFGLSHVSRDRIVAAFADLAAITADCPRGCTHETAEPECALDDAVRRGELAPVRLESFRRMLGSGQ
jgi:ribosome biogenesis GTPase / thiamine phosphate phosphatase